MNGRCKAVYPQSSCVCSNVFQIDFCILRRNLKYFFLAQINTLGYIMPSFFLFSFESVTHLIWKVRQGTSLQCDWGVRVHIYRLNMICQALSFTVFWHWKDWLIQKKIFFENYAIWYLHFCKTKHLEKETNRNSVATMLFFRSGSDETDKETNWALLLGFKIFHKNVIGLIQFLQYSTCRL